MQARWPLPMLVVSMLFACDGDSDASRPAAGGSAGSAGSSATGGAGEAGSGGTSSGGSDSGAGGSMPGDAAALHDAGGDASPQQTWFVYVGGGDGTISILVMD